MEDAVHEGNGQPFSFHGKLGDLLGQDPVLVVLEDCQGDLDAGIEGLVEDHEGLFVPDTGEFPFPFKKRHLRNCTHRRVDFGFFGGGDYLRKQAVIVRYIDIVNPEKLGLDQECVNSG